MIKYLVKKNHTYWFRRKINGFGEILLSLKTKNYDKAITRHSFIDFNIKKLVYEGVFQKMSVTEIRRLIEKYKHFMLTEDYNDFEEIRDNELTIEINGKQIGGHTAEALDIQINKYHKIHSSNDDNLIEIEAKKILERSNLKKDYQLLKNDKDKKIFHWELFKAELELLYQSLDRQCEMLRKENPTQGMNKRRKENFSQMINEFTKNMLNSSINEETKKLHLEMLNRNNPNTNNFTISKLVEEYINEKKVARQWTEKNTRDILYVFKYFSQYFQDKNANDLSRLNFTNYRDNVLKNLPLKITHNQFKDKDIFQILHIVKENKVATISILTINKHLRRLHQVFNWASSNGYIDKNYTKDLTLVDKTKNKSKRSNKTPYEKVDLIKMFNSHYFTTNLEQILKSNPENVFFPLIAMFTGAKQAEIALLKTKDIRKKDGIWYFDFNKNVKTNYTNRKTPVADKLIEIGFLDYVNYQKKNKEDMLFEKVKFYSDSNINFTNKFSIYNRKYISEDKNKTFYSFKHLVNQLLKNTKTPIYVINDIVGHSDGKGNKDIEVYGNDTQPISILKEAIESSINYDYLDFSHLKSMIKKVYN